MTTYTKEELAKIVHEAIAWFNNWDEDEILVLPNDEALALAQGVDRESIEDDAALGADECDALDDYYRLVCAKMRGRRG